MLRRTRTCLFALLSFPVFSHAELYQWTDAQGRVHFSDKKPSAAAETPVQVHSNTSGMPKFNLPEPRPRSFNNPKEGVQLQIKLPEFLIRPNSRVGAYYFGGDCVSPTAIPWSDLQNRYPLAIPREIDFRGKARSILRSSNISYREFSSANYANDPDLLLEPNIVSIDLHACVPKPIQRANPRYSVVSFTHSTAMITVQWTLKTTRREQKTLMMISTEGAAPLPATAPGEQTMNQALLNAYLNALTRVFENAEIFDHLRRPPPAPRPTPQKIVPKPAPEEPGFFEELSGLPRSMIERQEIEKKLVDIVVNLSPIKTMVTEFFASEGYWPTDFAQLNLDASALTRPDRIAGVQLGVQGEIIADVSPAFGAGAQLTLIPEHSMAGTMMRWTCKAEIESAAAQSWLTEHCQ